MPTVISQEPVSDDWRRRFFLHAENICDADLQFLWGKILAGEVASPGSYSLRTLEVLRSISSGEAELFRKMCGLAFEDGWVMIPGGHIGSAFVEHGITFGSILELQDAGLLYYHNGLVKEWVQSTPPTDVLVSNGIHMQIAWGNGNPLVVPLRIPCVAFTKAGDELQKLVEPNPVMSHLEKVAEYFRSHGVAVKRGTETKMLDGQTVLTFDEEF